jgi:D-3-phosphoglycerate dehydrogenase / 2-oxoglutarate reductase
VYEKEPLPRNSKLLNFPEVLLTPHVGAYTEDAFMRASEEAVLKLIHFFRDGTTSDILPPKAAWYNGSLFSFI